MSTRLEALKPDALAKGLLAGEVVRIEHLLQAVLAPATAKDDGLFLPDRPLGTVGAKVALASCMGLIDAGVERALNALRKLRNAFAHSAE